MTTALFRHLQSLRANFTHIGAAVSASREFSQAGTRRGEHTNPVNTAIPL